MRWKQTCTLVEAHAAGSVAKVLTGGIVDVPGETMLDKMRWFREHDRLRRLLLHEPRGAPATSVNVLLPSRNPRADLGLVIMEGSEYVAMSGSNTIGTVTVVLETGILPMTEPQTTVVLEAPGGLVEATCRCRDGKVESVRFANVPAFVVALDAHVEVEGLGTLRVDVAYGGMFYAIVEARDLGFALTRGEAREICVVGERVRTACRAQIEAVHPQYPELAGVQSVEVVGPVRRRGTRLASRNTVVVHPGHLDRSPCGTGTSARLAVLHARRRIRVGEPFEHESILDTKFVGEITGTTRIGGRRAIRSSITGSAWITGIAQYGLDPTDPFPEGFTLADTWLEAV